MPLGGKVLPVVDAVVAASASEKAGVQAGDRIKRVGVQEITEWAQFVHQVQQSPQQPLEVTVERAGSELTLTLTPDAKKVRGQLVGFVGLSPQLVHYRMSIGFCYSMGLCKPCGRAPRRPGA